MLKNKMLFLPRFYCKPVNATHYVTTPIFYVNASPHIGHLYSAVIADAICRYQRLLYPDRANNIRLCTGTDEHGTKIQQACALHNTPVAKYCDLVSDKFRSVFQKGFVQYTDFVRTTEERHINVVRHVWQTLRNSGDIYMSEYRGWYCVADETFLPESQVRLDGTSSIRYSLESNQPVEWTEEQNYMFRLSKYQSDILYWLKQENRVRPVKFEKILLDLLAEPLPDISISRPAKRVHWAIPVPDDSSQTIYVWLDALINYLTATGYPDKNFALWWPPKVQVIGKDILKFHGIYWPAFLISAGLEPPRQLFVHSHWIVDGQKMSKSKNNVVDPQMASEVFTMEALRYFLLREGTAHSDSNYSSVKAMRIINAELADTLGNLLSRVCAASLNPRQIYPRLHTAQLRDIVSTESGHKLRNVVEQLEAKCTQHYNENNFYLAADYIMLTLHAANSFFEYSRPWELKLKTSSEDVTKRCNLPMPQSNESALRLETIIAVTMDTLRVCGIALQPLLPQLSARLLDKLSVPYSERMWCNLSNHFIQVVEGKQEPPLEVSLSRTNTVLFKRLTFKTDDKVPLKEHSVNTKTTTTTTTTATTTTTTNSTDSTKKKSKKLVS